MPHDTCGNGTHPSFKENTLLVDGCGCAIIGCTEEGNVVYSYERLVDHFACVFTDPHAECDEDAVTMGIGWVSYNVIGGLVAPIKGALMPYIIAEWDEESTGDLEQDCLIRN